MKRIFYAFANLCMVAACFTGEASSNFTEKTNDNMNSGKAMQGSTISQIEIKQAKEIFDKIWKNLVKKYGEKNIKFPNKVILLNGAPGAGKGENISNLMRVFEIFANPIEVSLLLSSPEAQAVKATGGLVDDATVISNIFDVMLQKSNNKGVIIDGFPRTRVQAQFLKLLITRLQATDQNKWCEFKIINFVVSHDTSVKRQLKRGQLAAAHNKAVDESKQGKKIEVRETDTSSELASVRYKTYVNETQQCFDLLKDLIDYDEIDAEKSIDDVRLNIYKTLSK